MADNWIPKIAWNSFAGAEVYTFAYPAEGDPFNEDIRPNWDQHVSNSGNRQVQRNFTEEIWQVTYAFISSADKATLKTSFLAAWAALGKTFRYYPSSNSATYYTVALNNPEVKFTRQIPDGSGDFLYKMNWTLRQVS